jgi:hypothetical protein
MREKPIRLSGWRLRYTPPAKATLHCRARRLITASASSSKQSLLKV